MKAGFDEYNSNAFDIYPEIILSKLYHKDNEHIILSRWRMNLIAIIHEPYYWLCIAVQDQIVIYKLNIAPSNLKPEAMYDRYQHLLPDPVFSKYAHNPIAFCAVKSTINHINSLQHHSNPLLFSCSKNGKVSIFDCSSINAKIYGNTFLPIMTIDNNEFIPNSPNEQLGFDDYSVWSLDVKHCKKYKNRFFLGFGSNTHFLRVFKVYINDYNKTGEWFISSLINGAHGNNVPDLSFSDDNLYVSTVCIDGTLRIWKNCNFDKHDENDEHISRVISNEEPVITYKMTSSQLLWSVVWIDLNSIASKKEEISPTINIKKLHRIGNKFNSLKNKLKHRRKNSNENGSDNKAKESTSAYVDIFNFDPSAADCADPYESKEEINISSRLLMVGSETKLYLFEMSVDRNKMNIIDVQYEINKVLSINNIYNIDKHYMNRTMSDRLQFLRYIPELSMIICASSAYPCIAILTLYKDNNNNYNYKHHGFYPQNWMTLNFECKNCLFVAGMEIIPIKNAINQNQIDFYRIVLLYHSCLISIINVQSKRNCLNNHHFELIL